MPLSPPSSERALYAAVALVVVGFLGATFYTHHAVARVQGYAAEIVSDTAPSVEHLAAARAEVHHLEDLVHEYVHGVSSPADLSPLASTERRLETHLAAYVALPALAAEQSLRAQIQQAMEELRLLTREAVERTHAGDHAGALALIRGPLHEVAERAREAISADIELNARAARETAGQIEETRVYATRVALGATGLAVLLALLAGLLAGRSIRRSTRAMKLATELQERRAAELEQFAGRVAHDVLSPLGPVAAALDVVEERLDLVDDDEEGRAMQYVRRARAGLRRVELLVVDLLNFARAGARPERGTVCPVAAAAREALEEVAEEARAARVEVVCEVPERLAVRCSSALLTVALRNLVRNAIKYMGTAPVRRVVVRAAPSSGGVLLEVEDSGSGLAPGLEAQVFEPFVRGPSQGSPGTGLGLATVKRIAEAHGGRVGVRPALPSGCVFWLELPRASSRSSGRTSAVSRSGEHHLPH